MTVALHHVVDGPAEAPVLVLAVTALLVEHLEG